MKITLLGTGTCVSQLPAITNRFPGAYLFEYNGTKLLFECPEGVRFQLEKAGHDYSQVRNIAVSHSHPDHFSLIPFVQSVYCKGLIGGKEFYNEEINIYCPKFIADNFQSYWNFLLPELKNQQYEYPKLKFFSLVDDSFDLGNGITINSKKVYHGFGKCDSLAYRVETADGVFVYSGDTGDCAGIREITKNANVFLCESTAPIGSKDNATGYGHLNPSLVGEIAKNSAVKCLILTHYYGKDSDAALEAAIKESGYQGKMVIGKDLQEIDYVIDH